MKHILEFNFFRKKEEPREQKNLGDGDYTSAILYGSRSYKTGHDILIDNNHYIVSTGQKIYFTMKNGTFEGTVGEPDSVGISKIENIKTKNTNEQFGHRSIRHHAKVDEKPYSLWVLWSDERGGYQHKIDDFTTQHEMELVYISRNVKLFNSYEEAETEKMENIEQLTDNPDDGDIDIIRNMEIIELFPKNSN